MDKIPFMILAGSPPESDPLMQVAGVEYKALIEINEKPMIDYVPEAVYKSGLASYILVVGLPEDQFTLPGGLLGW